MKSIWAVFTARLKEFYRERTGLYWSFLMPLLIVLGLSFVFSKDHKDTFEIALIDTQVGDLANNIFFQWDQLHLITMEQLEAEEKLAKHKVDMAVRLDDRLHYWINSTSKNGHLLERLLRAESNVPIVKNTITLPEVAYIDWVLPGILGMNIMFNCLWGIGFIIVKYRDNGFLKRLKATPLKAYEYLLAQVLARYLIGFVVTAIVFVGSKMVIDFQMKGSYFDLFIVYTAGITSLISLGMLVACRTVSKEFADGFLNALSWPMMMLSGVWFSLEGASPFLIQLSNLLPLTHLVDASRAIMTEGATLNDVMPNIYFMVFFSVLVLSISSYFFKWGEE